MAGGMGGRRPGHPRETLAERVAATRAREAGEQLAARTAEPTPPTVKHAWYDGPYGRQPALLLGWRNLSGRFDGRICVAAPDEEGWVVTEMWVDAAMLSPA